MDKLCYKDATGRLIYTAVWKKLQKEARGLMQNDRKGRKRKAITYVNDVGDLLTMGELSTRFNLMALRQAADWVVGLCKCLFVLYGCHECFRYPLKASHWWRMSPLTVYAPSSDKKKWKCPFCCADFKPSLGLPYRILIFADPDSEDKEVQIARLGEVSLQNESLVHLFQLARMLEDSEAMVQKEKTKW